MTTIATPRPVAADACDSALLDAIARRDEAALAALYDRYGQPCYALARRITGDEEMAAEVVQDTFLALWRRPDGYQPARGRFVTWLLGVTHHRAVDAVRREQPHRSRRGTVELLDQTADTAMPPAEQAIVRDRAGRARTALAALPAPQREALLLAYYGGYTQREIAGLVGVPLGTVKTRTAAALTRLRGLLAGDEDTP